MNNRIEKISTIDFNRGVSTEFEEWAQLKTAPIEEIIANSGKLAEIYRQVIASYTINLPKGDIELGLIKLNDGTFVINIIQITGKCRKFVNQYTFDDAKEALIEYKQRVALMVKHSTKQQSDVLA